MLYLGDFPEDATVYIPFNTFTSNDPAASSTVTNLTENDIYVHKDGSIANIVSDGASVVINFDGITGNHLITIDTSEHADFATGSEYSVRIEGATVDAGTINSWVGAFSIERAGGALALVKAGVTLGNGAITNASLAGNMEIVFETDFTTNYNTTTNAWVNNYTDIIGTMDAAAFGADFITEAKIADNALANEHFADNCLTTTEGDWEQAGVAPTAAEINTEVDNSMVTYGLDHLFFASVTGTDVVDNSVIAKLVSKEATADWDDYVNTTESLQALRDHIADGTNLTESGGDGDHLTAINLPNQTMDITGDITGNLSGSVGSVTGHTNQSGDTYSVISGLTTAGAANLALSAAGIIGGIAATGTLSTTVMTSDLSGFVDDELIGRTVIWTGGTANGQASDITDYASTDGTVTYTAIKTAPLNNDTFVIV